MRKKNKIQQNKKLKAFFLPFVSRESEKEIQITSEIESFRRRKGDLHEMGLFKLTIPGQIVNNRDFSLSFELWLSPNFCSLRAGFSVFPFLGDL